MALNDNHKNPAKFKCDPPCQVLDEVRVFGTQVNLTHLAMHSNRFTRLPVGDLIKHRHLSVLDVRHNRIQGYDPEFTDMIKNQGLQIRYNGEAETPPHLNRYETESNLSVPGI